MSLKLGLPGPVEGLELKIPGYAEGLELEISAPQRISNWNYLAP
jgi:hypothetical protein